MKPHVSGGLLAPLAVIASLSAGIAVTGLIALAAAGALAYWIPSRHARA